MSNILFPARCSAHAGPQRDAHAHTHTRTRAHTRTHAHRHTRAHVHACTHSHARTRTRTRTHARTHARTHPNQLKTEGEPTPVFAYSVCPTVIDESFNACRAQLWTLRRWHRLFMA
eukprot:2452001-Amphidinium_carterae.1